MANTALPYIDWETVAAHPKPFWGYSDLTALLNASMRRPASTAVFISSGIWSRVKNRRRKSRGRIFTGRFFRERMR